MAESADIIIPGTNDGFEGPWTIKHSWLKLELMYGLLGPWTPNWSLAFDTYAATRGPLAGAPNLADFCLTTLMNSRLRTTDVQRLTAWLAVPENRARLEDARACLAKTKGLADATDRDLTPLASLIDSMVEDRGALRGIHMAKIYKWLAAWAPAHVPMIDRYVHDALTNRARRGSVPALELLRRFRRLVRDNARSIAALQQAFLRDAHPEKDPRPALTAVRVVDKLLWFDWWGIYRYAGELGRWVTPVTGQNAQHHGITVVGEEHARSQGLL